MSKIKVHKTKDYTIIANGFLRNGEMSLKAKGLLTLLLSLPDNWEYSANGLLRFAKDGDASLQATLHELESLGYLTRSRLKGPNGKYNGVLYDIYEDSGDRPFAEEEKPEIEAEPQGENPISENPN